MERVRVLAKQWLLHRDPGTTDNLPTGSSHINQFQAKMVILQETRTAEHSLRTSLSR